MSVESNIYGIEPVNPSSYSGMEFIRPELEVVSQVEQQEAIIPQEQHNALLTWVEENKEDATIIGEVLTEDSIYAGIFSIMASSEELRSELKPVIMTVIRKRLVEGNDEDIATLLTGNSQPTIVEPQAELAGTSRWAKIREKAMSVYVKLDAGIAEEVELERPLGQSWGVKTLAEAEQEVALDPRKSIRMANFPEFRVIRTEPSRFVDFLNSNKTLDTICNTVEKPLAVIVDKAKVFDPFLDDSRTGNELMLDSLNYAADKIVDGFVKLMEYDEKLLAATISMLRGMDVQQKYTKARAYESELTEKIADKIINTVTEYDYKAAFNTVSSSVHPESRRTKAALAAGIAMTWVALTTGSIETDIPDVVHEKRVEKTVPVVDRPSFDRKASIIRIPEFEIKPNGKQG